MNELTALTFHHFFMKWGIKKATFDYTKDGKIQYEYIYLSRYEFQLGKIGDVPTNYTIPESEEVNNENDRN